MMFLRTMSCVLGMTLVGVAANLQSWSQQTYPNERLALFCNNTLENYTIGNDDSGVWRKLEKEGRLKTDADYELSTNGLVLVIKNVTDQTSGIYLCDVKDKNGDNVARAIKGVNIDGHLYDGMLDKYRTNVIRGVITAAAVFVLVVGVCLIDRFQYQNDEQKLKQKTRKLERRKHFNKPEPEGKDNPGMVDNEETNDVNKSYGSLKEGEGTTHL